MTKSEKNSAEITAKQSKKALAYDKEQIIRLAEFARDIDVLAALLDDNKQYTIVEAQKMIDAYKKKGVK